jgi:hypothetical protein
VGAIRGMQQHDGHSHAPVARTSRPLKPSKVKVVKN